MGWSQVGLSHALGNEPWPIEAFVVSLPARNLETASRAFSFRTVHRGDYRQR